MGSTNMAEPKRRRGVGRPTVPQPKRPFASIRGRPEFEAWFKGLSSHSRLSGSILIEHALIEYAKNHGYDVNPPER
jgi:hypothetical protein